MAFSIKNYRKSHIPKGSFYIADVVYLLFRPSPWGLYQGAVAPRTWGLHLGCGDPK